MDYYATKDQKNGSPEVEIISTDSPDYDDKDEYNPTNSDTELNLVNK